VGYRLLEYNLGALHLPADSDGHVVAVLLAGDIFGVLFTSMWRPLVRLVVAHHVYTSVLIFGGGRGPDHFFVFFLRSCL
jgi:hypothetical protein